MSYTKQNFVSGQVLKADHLNAMDAGIETNDIAITELAEDKVALPVSNEGVDHGTAGQFAVSDGKGGIVWKTLVEAEAVMY